MIQVKSKEEAIEWAKRCPPPFENQDSELEIRQVFEAEDFPEEAAHERKLRDELAKRR